jgi:hypothetical protein
MDRWRRAFRALWQQEPAFALALYFALAIVTVSYARWFGGAYDHGHGIRFLTNGTDHLVVWEGSAAGLAELAWCTWRMWMGGYICWTLSVLYKALVSIGAVAYSASHPSLFLVGLAALNLASLYPLFTWAVLSRVDRTDSLGQQWRARIRRWLWTATT